MRLLLISFVLALSASLAFAQSGGVKGKVKSNRGAGIPNASVTARQSGKDIKTVKADSKGEFQLTGLDSGVYSLVFDADGFQSGLLQGVEVKSGSTRNLGDRLILALNGIRSLVERRMNRGRSLAIHATIESRQRSGAKSASRKPEWKTERSGT